MSNANEFKFAKEREKKGNEYVICLVGKKSPLVDFSKPTFAEHISFFEILRGNGELPESEAPRSVALLPAHRWLHRLPNL